MVEASTISTVGGYATIVTLGVCYYFFVHGRRVNKNIRPVGKKEVQVASPRKDQKSKKGRKDGGLSSGADEKKKQPQPKQQPQQQAKAAVVEKATANGQTTKDTSRDEDVDNREFARQFSNVQAGTVIASKSQSSSRQKSVKQTRAQEKPVVETSSDNATAPSSTAGADADDDRSPISSPNLPATTMPTNNGDVSDMLEKSADGPSVLKITAPTNPSQPKKAKAATPAAPQESKKARQNRLKKERDQAERQAAEIERKALMEKQRKTAREAEGRAAKDGSAFMASNVPSSSAWSESPAANGSKQETSSSKIEMLDTFKPAASAEPKGSQLEQELSKISEDEQMRIAKEESNNWETVKDKRKKAKKAVNAQQENKDANRDKQSSDEQSDFTTAPVRAPVVKATDGTSTQTYAEVKKPVQREVETQDDEWEVS